MERRGTTRIVFRLINHQLVTSQELSMFKDVKPGTKFRVDGIWFVRSATAPEQSSKVDFRDAPTVYFKGDDKVDELKIAWWTEECAKQYDAQLDKVVIDATIEGGFFSEEAANDRINELCEEHREVEAIIF